jgi:uncharacterized protein (DUF58 family)
MEKSPAPSRRFGRIRAWLDRLPLTGEGLLWFVLATGLLLMGMFKGINLVILLGCLLVVLVLWNVAMAYWQLRAVGATRLPGEPAFARTPFRCSVRLHNSGSRAAGGLAVRDEAAMGQQWFVTRVPARSSVVLQAQVSFPRRGRVEGGLLVVESGYPLGLARARRPAEGAASWVVLPQLGQVHRARLRRLLNRHGPSLGRARGFPCHAPTARAEFHGLRPYRPGDSPRHIHWRTTARYGELMVREYEDWPSDNLILVLEARKDPAQGEADDPLLERAISLAASTCWEWCRQTGDRLVLAVAGAESTVLEGATNRDLALRLLERLALEPGTLPDPAPVVAQLQARQLPPGPVLVISPGESRLAGQVQDALRRTPVAIDVSSGDADEFFEL